MRAHIRAASADARRARARRAPAHHRGISRRIRPVAARRVGALMASILLKVSLYIGGSETLREN